MSIMGTRVVRNEDPVFLSRGAMYTDDLTDDRLTGALHLTLVRSPLAHARITSIDVEEARSAPGVVAVVTGADIDLEPPLLFPMAEKGMVRPWLATEKVRFVGEPVVAVLTEQAYQGQDAADLVEIDYDPLPAVVDLRAAASDEVLVFEDVGTNTTNGFGLDEEFDEHLFDDCEVVVTQEIVNQRLAACALETRAASAVWGDDGRVTLWCSTQNAQNARDEVAGWLGVDAAQVHVIAPDVGGGFGAKIGADPEFALVCWLAKHTVAAGPVERDPVGEHDRDAARAGPAADRHHRRQPRRRRARLPDRRARRRRGLPAARRRAADVHPDDGPRRLRHPQGRVAGPGGGHHDHVDRRLPRRRPAGGHRGDRARDGPVRGRDRQGPGRGAPAQPGGPGQVPVHDQGRRGLRLRRVRQGAGPGARGRRLPGAAGRAGRPPGARRRGAARARASRCSWRSPAAARSPRTPRWRCTPTARSPCSPAPRRTARGTPPRGPCWPASTWASRSRRSPSSTGTPT